MKFGGEGKQEIKIFCIIPYILYLYRGKVSEQVTVYKDKRTETNHIGYFYGISIFPNIQIQFAHGSKK